MSSFYIGVCYSIWGLMLFFLGKWKIIMPHRLLICGRICISVSKRKIVQEILGYPLPCCMDVVKPVLWNLWKDPSENFEGVFSKMYVPLLHQLLHHESLQKPLFYCCSGLLIQTFPMNILRVLPKHLLRSCVHFCKTILLKTLKGSFRKGLFRCCISFHI